MDGSDGIVDEHIQTTRESLQIFFSSNLIKYTAHSSNNLPFPKRPVIVMSTQAINCVKETNNDVVFFSCTQTHRDSIKKKNKKKEREFVDLEEEFLKKRNIYFYTIALKKWRVIFLSFLKKKNHRLKRSFRQNG